MRSEEWPVPRGKFALKKAHTRYPGSVYVL